MYTLQALLITACGVVDSGGPHGPPGTPPPPGGGRPTGAGHVTWTFNGHVFRIAAAAGTAREDVTAELAGSRSGNDRWLAPSSNGAFLVLSSERFSAAGEVLVRATGDLKIAEVVLAGGSPVFAESISAINDDGTVIVYASQGGSNEIDLFRTNRISDGVWSAPQLLTANSGHRVNSSPAFRFDQPSVLFDCGNTPAPESGNTESCEVGIDGGQLRIIVSPATLPNSRNSFTQFPHAGTRGVLFQGSWPINGTSPETIWRLDDRGVPVPATPTFNNAVSPCGLADGRTVMLWLDRPGNTSGAHELTVVDTDDATFTTLASEDVADIGIGCSD